MNEDEQFQEEEEFDEEGFLVIPRISLSKETHESIPPSSCDVTGTISITISYIIPMNTTVSISSQDLEMHIIPSTSTSETTLDKPHDNLDTV